MRVKHLKNNQVDIDEEIVLKYLRYNARYIDGITSKVLKESIAELKEIGQAKYVYSTFDITTGNGTVNFDDQLIVYSNSLTKLYKNSVKSTIFAATLGFEVEKRIRYYSKTDLSKAIVFDACAGVYIESICNYIDDEIKQIARKEGYGTTYRFSPGYGDFPILYQNQILKLLNAEKHIGLLANESHILLPRKSVTAFIGWDMGTGPLSQNVKN